ncbi:myb-related transcription factor, partner of profilin-like [Plectropomus leopardus]|uniref:myb-related transcription factor, partner of profilin-like n=1 Tax=Plectropomus leopardus TaxID=160734 RepID=UPI001C4D1395|nr:myb-related transcription factor, partner of profilin-like [Plectropomus leopardus]
MEEQLIIAVIAHPELYDSSCPLYRDRNKKDQAWVSVSEVCGLSVEQCRKRWKSLRDTYIRERRKVPRSGAAAGTAKRWKYLGVLSFLDPFVAPRLTSGNMGQGVEEDGTPEQSRESVEDEGETAGPSQREEEYQDEEEEPAVSPSAPGSPPAAAVPAAAPAALARPQFRRKKTQKRAREAEEQRHQEIEALLLEALRARPPPPSAPQPPPRSEDQLFLDSLAPSLERLEPQVKAYVKFQIHKIIYEASTVVLLSLFERATSELNSFHRHTSTSS